MKSMLPFLPLALLPFVACAPAPATSATPTGGTEVRNLPLESVNTRTSLSGRVELAAQGGGKTRYTLFVTGLEAGTNHAAHIHSGSCRKPGGIMIPLTEVTVDAGGNGSSSTVVEDSRLPIIAYIMVHERATNAANGAGSGVACVSIR